MPRVTLTDAVIRGRSSKPRVRIFQQWRYHPITRAARLSRNFMKGWTDLTTGTSITRSTRTADRAEAERIAQATEAKLPKRERDGRPRPARLV